jgi:L-rhamnose mutarotase
MEEKSNIDTIFVSGGILCDGPYKCIDFEKKMANLRETEKYKDWGSVLEDLLYAKKYS